MWNTHVAAWSSCKQAFPNDLLIGRIEIAIASVPEQHKWLEAFEKIRGMDAADIATARLAELIDAVAISKSFNRPKCIVAGHDGYEGIGQSKRKRRGPREFQSAYSKARSPEDEGAS